jgi:RES domain-containing protein
LTAAWRLVKTRFLASAWDGEGARAAGGRWNSVGVPVVYVSSTLSLALVEVLVHLPAGLLGAYAAVPVSFDDTQVEPLPDAGLPADWREVPPPPSTRSIGDRFVADGRALALRVPSVVVPSESNYVLNPAHPAFASLQIGAPVAFPFDPRLVRP